MFNGSNSTSFPFNYHKNYQAPASNVTFNFLVSNSVSAPATAMASNTNSDNDMITNSAVNAGGKRRRKRRVPAILQAPFHNTKESNINPTKVVDKKSHSNIFSENAFHTNAYRVRGRTFETTAAPLIGLVMLYTIVFIALAGYIFFAELSTNGYISNQPKGISIIPSSIISPNITSTNMTSSVVESMETVVTSNTNEDNDVISNICNNNGMIIMSALPVNVCVNAGRAFMDNFLPRNIAQNIIYYLAYKNPWSGTETEIERPSSINQRELANDASDNTNTNITSLKTSNKTTHTQIFE